MSNFDEIAETFEFFDDWEEKYKYIIDLGRTLPEFPEDQQTEENRVHGCTSRVWLIHHMDGDKLMLQGDSDAHIVKGLIALVLTIYSGKTLAEIVKTDAIELLGNLGLQQHLSPMRTNGLHSMVERIKSIAQTQLQSA